MPSCLQCGTRTRGSSDCESCGGETEGQLLTDGGQDRNDRPQDTPNDGGQGQPPGQQPPQGGGRPQQGGQGPQRGGQGNQGHRQGQGNQGYQQGQQYNQGGQQRQGGQPPQQPPRQGGRRGGGNDGIGRRKLLLGGGGALALAGGGWFFFLRDDGNPTDSPDNAAKAYTKALTSGDTERAKELAHADSPANAQAEAVDTSFFESIAESDVDVSVQATTIDEEPGMNADNYDSVEQFQSVQVTLSLQNEEDTLNGVAAQNTDGEWKMWSLGLL